MLLSDWLYLHSYQKPSGLRLLKALDPAVALSYQSLLGKIKTPENFYKIDPKAYVKNPNTGKVYSSISYQQIQRQTLTPERLQASLNLGEAYFATIDFRKINDEEEQRYVLALLQAAIQNKKRFTYLNLSGCSVINESQLFDLLQKIPEVKELNLQDCPQFNLSTLFSLFSFKVNQQLVGLRWEYDVLCPNLRKLSVTLEGNVQILDIALTLFGRKQLLDLIINLQQQLSIYLNKLLARLNDKDEYMRGTAAESLGKLMARMSTDQVIEVIEKLLTKFNDKYENVQTAVANSLSQLMVRLTTNQVNEVIKKLLIKLDDKKWRVQLTTIYSLSQLAVMLTADQVGEVIKKLLANLGGDEKRYIGVTAAKTAAKSLGKLIPRIPENLVSAVIEKLLATLNDHDPYVRDVAIQSLGELALKVPTDQIYKVIKKLLAKDYVDNKAAVAESLGKLIDKIAIEQVDQVLEKLVAIFLNDPGIEPAIAKILSKLAARIPLVKLDQVIEKLLGLDGLFVSEVVIESFGELMTKIPITHLDHVIEKFLVSRLVDDHLLAYFLQKNLIHVASNLPTEIKFKVVENLLAKLNDIKSNDEIEVLAILSFQSSKLYSELIAGTQINQVNKVLEKILLKLDDDNAIVRKIVSGILIELVVSIPKAKVDQVIKKLLAKLDAGDEMVRAAVAYSLGELTAKLPVAQGNAMIEKLLARLSYEEKHVQAGIDTSLSELATKLTIDEVKTIINQLLVYPYEREYVRVAIMKSLSQLNYKIFIEQINEVVTELMTGLNNKYQCNRAEVVSRLGQLIVNMPTEKVSEVIEKLLIRLQDKDKYVRAGAVSSLAQVAFNIPGEKVRETFEKLLARLSDNSRIRQELNRGDDYFDIRELTIKSLNQLFSYATQFQFLQNWLLKLKNNIIDQSDTKVFSKLFSFLDEKTLLQVVPQVSKDWRRSQKDYLKQQAELIRTQHGLLITTDSNSSANDLAPSNFERFFQNSSKEFVPAVTVKTAHQDTINHHTFFKDSTNLPSLSKKNKFEMNNGYWYTAEDIDKLLKLQLQDGKEVEICAGHFPFLINTRGDAASLLQDTLQKILSKPLPAIIPINLVDEASLNEHGLSANLQGTHWIGLAIIPLPINQPYTHKMMIIDSCGNGLNEDKDISTLNLLEISKLVDKNHARYSLWEKVSQLMGLIQAVQQRPDVQFNPQIIMTSKVQQKNGSDCGAFVVQNLVSVLKENGQLCKQKGQQLRALHYKLLEQNSFVPPTSTTNDSFKVLPKPTM